MRNVYHTVLHIEFVDLKLEFYKGHLTKQKTEMFQRLMQAIKFLHKRQDSVKVLCIMLICV